MRIALHRSVAPSLGPSARARRPERGPAAPADVQRLAAQGARPSSDLLALQRLAVQRERPEEEGAPLDSAGVHQAARAGTSGSGGPLPFLDTIQSSFGRHDLSGVAAHTGPQAAAGARAMNAAAFTTGNNIAFAGQPTLRTAAHEAAHVIQQRAGVSLSGGVGQEGDRYERNADAVADRVAQGQSAEPLLDEVAGRSPGAVQRETAEEEESVQQKCATCKEEESVQRESAEDEEPVQQQCATCQRGSAVQRQAACPARLLDSDPVPRGFKNYFGSTAVFHCGYRTILEDRVPAPADPINECVYDHGGALVDGNHPDAGCRGTPDQYYSKTDPVKHALIDSGGIVRAGLPALVASGRHALGEAFGRKRK